jgi:uncharacterized protein YlxP (DUF503 family)
LFLHAPQNLKEKRGMVRRLLGRCRERFPVSAAETGSHELWQRTELGFAMVGTEEGLIQALFQRVEEEIDRIGLGEIVESRVEFIHY